MRLPIKQWQAGFIPKGAGENHDQINEPADPETAEGEKKEQAGANLSDIKTMDAVDA